MVEPLLPTDHVLAVRGGASSAFLRAAEGDLHLLHLLLEDLLLLGQLLVAVCSKGEREWERERVHRVALHRVGGLSVGEVGGGEAVRLWLTPWPGCGAPRSPRTASDCCPPSPLPQASAYAPPPGASGCSSEGRRRSTPTLMSHWGGREHAWACAHCTIFRKQLHLRRTFECCRSD